MVMLGYDDAAQILFQQFPRESIRFEHLFGLFNQDAFWDFLRMACIFTSLDLLVA